MFLPIAIAILAMIIIGAVLAHDGMFRDDTFPAIMFTFLFGFIGYLIGVLVTLIVSASLWGTDAEIMEETQLELVSLQDNFGIDGQFFLGCGGITTQSDYYYYYKTETGGFKQGKTSPRDVEIFFSEGTPMKITYKRMFPKDDWKRTWLINSGDKSYRFEVPKGTIKTDYNLDLQ